MAARAGLAQPDPAAVHACTCGAHTITRACPVSCLAAVLSAAAFNLLARACDTRHGPAATTGHAADLYLTNQLAGIDGIGPRRAGEIAVSLIYTGLIRPDGTAGTDPRTLPGSMKPPEVMKVPEVAAAFKVNPRTIIRWTDTGKLPCYRTPGGHRRFRAADIRALIPAPAPASKPPARTAARTAPP
jgi:excisionase family DNA binding protein